MRTKMARVIIPKGISDKASKSSEFLFRGDEPTWNPLLTDHEINIAISSATSWYRSMVDDETQRQYLIDYAREFFPDKVEILEKVPSATQFHPYGAYARMLKRGANLPEKFVNSIKQKIELLCKEPPTEQKRKPKTIKVDPQLSGFIGNVDGMLDDYGIVPKLFPDRSMADFLLKSGATNKQRIQVHQHFSKRIAEFSTILSGKDPELMEGYSNISRKKIEKMYNWLVRQPSEDLVTAAPPTRKKKVKTAEDLTKFLKPKVEDKELKVRSIDPEDIIGASQLWVFNTETRKLGVFYAKKDKGLEVYRTSITEYNEETSIAKTIRRPEDLIPKIPTMGKVELRNILNQVNAVATPVRWRVTEDVILLRVIK